MCVCASHIMVRACMHVRTYIFSRRRKQRDIMADYLHVGAIKHHVEALHENVAHNGAAACVANNALCKKKKKKSGGKNSQRKYLIQHKTHAKKRMNEIKYKI